MTDETMKDGERAAFEAAWAAQYPDHGKCAFLRSGIDLERYATTRVQDGWLMWQARAAAPQSSKGENWHPADNGTAHYYTAEQLDEFDRATAPQAALTDEQRMAINTALGYLPVASDDCMRARITLRALLLQASTERMSDAAREGYRDYQDGMERENNPFLEPHSVGFQEWEKGWNAARKSEIERGEDQS